MVDVLGPNWKVAALAASAAGISGVVATYLWNEVRGRNNGLPQQVPQKWIKVGTVSHLFLYPVKSCQGMSIQEASATTLGLKATGNDYLRDRVFMVVDSRCVFQTQRTIPRLVLIKVEVQGNRLTLSGPEMAPLTLTIPEDKTGVRKQCRIFDDTVALTLDCGDEVGKWLDTFLNQTGFRLLYHPVLDKTQRERTPLQKKFPTFVPEDKGAFQDQTSFMMIAEESITELNKKLETPVSYRNFRPSILINGTPEAFAEDLWSYVRIGGEGGPIMKHAKPCTRCKLTTVNPDTAVFSEVNEPLRTLITIKRKYGHDKTDSLVKGQAVIGNQLGLCKAGTTIKVGDPVYAAAL